MFAKIKPILDSLKSSFKELILIYFILIFGLLFEIWVEIVSVTGEWDIRYFELILKRTALFLIPAYISYLAAKRGAISLLHAVLKNKNLFQNTLADFFIDIFIVTATVIMFLPVKPVIQDKRIVNDFYVTEAYVKYDLFPAIIILELLALLPVILLLTQKNNLEKFVKLGIIISALILAVFINSRSNFEARLFEARAAWKSESPEVLVEKARRALYEAVTPEEKALAYYWMGVGYNLMEDPKKAVEYQVLAIKNDPSSGAPHSSLAYAYLRLGESEKASQSAKKCIEHDPSYAWCYMAMGEYYLHNLKFREGYEMFKKARSYDPESREILDGMNNVVNFMKTNNISFDE